MAITIKEIAEKAGVSRGTVDRVLHGRGGVKPRVEEQVRAIARDMGYKPNRAGKMLAAKKQPIRIGCLLPSIGNVFFEDLVRGMRRAEKTLADFGVSVELVQLCGYDPMEHIRAVRTLLEDKSYAGYGISTIDIPEIRHIVNETLDRGAPVVSINTDLSDTRRICYVGSDYINGGSTAAGLVAKLMPGEKLRILIVTGSLKMKGHNERIQGFLQTLDARGIRYELLDMFETLDSDELACEKAKLHLRRHPDVNCIYIVAAGAAGVCRACESENIDLSRVCVVSNDAVPSTCEYLEKESIRFTICQDPEMQGYRSVHKIFDFLMGDREDALKDWYTGTIIKIKENLNN